MSFKEELPFILWKKINFYLNRVDIHVIDLCEKVFNQNGYLRIHMNKTLGICEINLLIRVLI